MSKEIQVFIEHPSFTEDSLPEFITWLHHILSEVYTTTSYTLNYIFCDDNYLLKINQQYLDHDYYTDIITFPLEVTNETIQSDLFISIDRVKDNAKTNKATFEHELLRVTIHGLLHLLGYDDKDEESKKEMRLKEEEMIAYYYLRLA